MKRIVFASFIVSLFLLSSCVEDTCESTLTYKAWQPVYKTNQELSDEISFVAERELVAPGKIYYYNQFLLISDQGTGVHIIDNSDTQNPKKLGFIEIEGNADIAFAGNYIYADTYYNILVIDIEDIQNPTVVGSINDVKDLGWGIDDGRLIVDYVETDITETIDCTNDQNDQVFWNAQQGLLFVNADFSTVNANQTNRGGVPNVVFDNNSSADFGQGGSLSRMALFGGYFYYVNEYSMNIYDVSDLTTPDKVAQAYMEWGVETIFPYKSNLFVGANNGMHIYDNEDPTNPVYLSTFAHANSCDPVVVQDDIAYVTLRSGNECENFVNQLDVVNVEDLRNPQLIASFPMHNPHGLAVRGNTLYLCEADEGLKVFDVSEVEEIHQNQIGHVKDYDAFDVISVSSQLLLMIGKDGFYQFDTKERESPKLLSSIPVI